MIVNPKNPSKKIDATKRVKFLHLTGHLLDEQAFLAKLAEALESGRAVVVELGDGTQARFPAASAERV